MFRQLLYNIQRYLNAQCTLRDLEAWLLSNLQRILDSGDETAIHMANQVDADLVEFGEGLIDESTFLERLESYLGFSETIPLSFYEAERRDTVKATAAVETIRHRLAVLGPVVDLRLSHEFV